MYCEENKVSACVATVYMYVIWRFDFSYFISHLFLTLSPTIQNKVNNFIEMSEEETELRDLVAQTLENNGVLSKIRAELRASVFLALEEQESVMDTAQFTNKPLKSFLSTTEGSLVASLVREFLEFFKLDFTLSVFDPETSHGKYYNYSGRSKLIKDLQLENLNGKKGPLLVQILQTALSRGSNSTNAKKDGSKLNSARKADLHTSSNLAAQGSLLLDNSPPNSAKGEKVLYPQTVSSSKNDNIVTKANSKNVTGETNTLSSMVEIAPKHITGVNTVPKLKDIQVKSLAAGEEISPRSLSVSEHGNVSQESKEGSKKKTGSFESTPCNSPSIEKSLSDAKHDLQVLSASGAIQETTSKSESKKKQLQNKANTESLGKVANSALSSLSNLPPLAGVGFQAKHPIATLPGISQQKDMHKIKAMIDLGLESQDNYDEDFNSTASASVKDDPTNQGTDSEIEEELGFGVEDLLSSASVMDDLTADATVSNLTGVADYMEDVN